MTFYKRSTASEWPPPPVQFLHTFKNELRVLFPESSHLLTPPLVCGDLPPPPPPLGCGPHPPLVYGHFCAWLCVCQLDECFTLVSPVCILVILKLNYSVHFIFLTSVSSHPSQDLPCLPRMYRCSVGQPQGSYRSTGSPPPCLPRAHLTGRMSLVTPSALKDRGWVLLSWSSLSQELCWVMSSWLQGKSVTAQFHHTETRVWINHKYVGLLS